MKTPFIWLNENEHEGIADCGCELTRYYDGDDNPAIELCPTHKAASLLRDACRETLDHLERNGELTPPGDDREWNHVTQLRAALKACEVPE